MKKILSGLLVLVGVFVLAAPSYAGSIYYTIPFWGKGSSGSDTLNTAIVIQSKGNLSTSAGIGVPNVDFAATGATVEIRLYNNVIRGSTVHWGTNIVSGSGGAGGLWGTIKKSFSSGHETFAADTVGGTASGGWATSSGWSSTSTYDSGYAVVEISSTTSTPSTGDFEVDAWYWDNSPRAGFPLTVKANTY